MGAEQNQPSRLHILYAQDPVSGNGLPNGRLSAEEVGQKP